MTLRTLLALCSLALGACAQLPGGSIDTTVPASPAPLISPPAAAAQLPTAAAPSPAPATGSGDATPGAAAALWGAAAAPAAAIATQDVAGPAATTPAAAAARATRQDAEDAANAVQASGMPTDPLEPEKPVALGNAAAESDLWTRVRDSFAMPLLDNDLVRDHEQWYSRRPDYVKRMTERGGRYLFHIVEEVQRRGMPGELALLPFIESAFNPQAMSSARASGMWQFMPATGRDFELKQNIFRDDRRDILASTRAALDYLERLYGMFGDWHLALAAYNWGEGNVQKAIARNRRAGQPVGYEDLKMPAETRHYVPKLQAVKNIVMEPARFSLELPDLRNHPYFLSVPIRRDIDVDLAARLAGLSVDEFKSLNPQMNKPVILAAGTPQILLPYDNADRFVRNLGAHRGPLASWTAWVVPRTMRPGDAARDSGMSESMLREINLIPPRMLVKAGSTLLVPRSSSGGASDVSEHLADNAAMMLTPDAPALRKIGVKARKGDTVASLAKRYRVSAAQVAQWNRLDSGARLATGSSLVIYQPAAKARAASIRTASTNAKVRGKAVRAAAKTAPARVARTAATSTKAKSVVRARGVATTAPRRIARN